MKPYQNDTGDFMQLMKDWYVQSNELIHFMIESFSFRPAGIQSDGEGDKTSSDNSTQPETPFAWTVLKPTAEIVFIS